MNPQQSMDTQKIAKNVSISKQLQPQQLIYFSAIVIKINKVGKKQERILAISNRNLLNIASPFSFLPNRIKRVMPLSRVLGVSEARKNSEVAIHMDGEDDYRFISIHFSKKIVQVVAILYSRSMGCPLKIYEYSENSLEAYTTTKKELKKGIRKLPAVLPKLLDEQKITNSKQSKLVLKYQQLSSSNLLEQFELLKVLGRGGYGKVVLCKNILNHQLYAVKILVLSEMKDESDIKKILSERELIQKTRHPFLVHLQYAFVSSEKIYLIMNYCVGGDLYQRIKKESRFSEGRTKFYAAQVFLALAQIHQLGYVYRDLKPENILIQANGYIKLADFGLAVKLQKGDKIYSNAGTRCYLSPEVLRKQGITYAVDWWAFGILIYQMLYGKPAFLKDSERQMYQQILFKDPHFEADIAVSDELKDFILKLLVKDPAGRLGTNDDDEVKNHPWFRELQWPKLLAYELNPSYVPPELLQDPLSKEQRPVDSITPCDVQKIQQFKQRLQSFEYSPQLSRTLSSNTNPETSYSPKEEPTSCSLSQPQ